MRFGLFFDSFEIQHTRARNKDTVWYGFAVRADQEAQPQWNRCITKLAGFVEDGARCYGPVKVGDRADGLHKLNNIKLGEYQWVPGDNLNPHQLKYAVMVVNAGAPKGIGPNKDMAGFAQNVLTNGKLGTLAPSNPKDFTGELRSLSGWRGCDGPTAAWTDTFTGELVDGLTAGTGSFHIPPPNIFTVPNRSGCGGSSKYRVNLSLKRSSWAAN